MEFVSVECILSRPRIRTSCVDFSLSTTVLVLWIAPNMGIQRGAYTRKELEIMQPHLRSYTCSLQLNAQSSFMLVYI